MSAVVGAMLAEGRLPFVRCQADGTAPAELASDGEEWMAACGICARRHSVDEIVWLLPSEAAKHGWWVAVERPGARMH